MLKDERRALIIKLINEKDFVKNTTLSEMTNSTIPTIINDINDLDRQGLIIKVYGGAKSIQSKTKLSPEYFEEEKINFNVLDKQRIAQTAAQLIEEDELIFIDTGTSTRQLIKYLNNRNVQIVTNGFSIALELLELDYDVCLVGGTIIPRTHATAGELSLKFLDNFHFDKSFIGVNNFDNNHFYTTNLQEAAIKERIVLNSKQTYILMDASKIGSINKFKLDIKKDVVLISNERPKNYKGNFILSK